MDTLIKNMEMPVDCRYCRFYRKQEDGIHYCHVQRTAISGGIEVLDKIKKGCPLVALPEHGDLIDRGLVQEVLAQLLPLVITNELTDKEIGLVHRTVGAIAEMINEQEVVVEATE